MKMELPKSRSRIRAALDGSKRVAGSGATVDEQYIFVDLGLQLELQVSRRQLAARPFRDIKKMADTFDDLADLVEARPCAVDCGGRQVERHFDPRALVSNEQYL